MVVHVAGGTLALIAGAASLSFRKGSLQHARVGNLFVCSMLVLAGTGSVIAAIAGGRGTAVIGVLTCYLVVTSWVAARKRDGLRKVELSALVVALSCTVAMTAFGITALNSPTGQFDTLPSPVYFVFAALAALAATLDVRFINDPRPSGAQRITRHLWRMCTAFFIAAASFFLGQQGVMPPFLKGSPLLFVPPFAILAVMIIWIIRLRVSKANLKLRSLAKR